MCFSATASFVAGTGLSVVGIATVRATTRRAEIPFAAIPLLFGTQQIIEGLVWLSFREGSRLPNGILTLAFSLFSHVLWPIFVPFAVSQLETVPWRRKVQATTQIAGIVVGLYLLYFLVRDPVASRVLGKHIDYESPHFYVVAVIFLYLFASCGGCLASSDRIIQAFGALLLVTFVAAYVIHAATLFSIWCFFAAILSLIVLVYLRNAHRPPATAEALGA